MKAVRYFIQEANERILLFNSRISRRKTIMLFKNLTKAVYYFIQDLIEEVRYFIQKANDGNSFFHWWSLWMESVFLFKELMKVNRYFIQESN